MKTFLPLLAILLSTINLKAQTETECKDPIVTGSLCSSVSQRRQDTREDSPYEYEFEERINKLACVDINKDSPEIINKKIHNWWIENVNKLVCDGASFNVPNGNILKLAAYKSFSQFLDKAVHDWKVPLNKIDSSDGRTTLDYLKDEINRNKGQPNGKPLQNYYDFLKIAGAKHKSELTPDELKRNGIPNGHKDCPADAPCKSELK